MKLRGDALPKSKKQKIGKFSNITQKLPKIAKNKKLMKSVYPS